MKSMALQIETVDIGKDCLVKVAGEVDLYSSPELRAAINKAFNRTSGNVAVDLRDVAYMDSSGVATLIEGLRSGTQQQRGFELIAPSNPVMKVLRLSRLDSVFTIRDTTEPNT